MRAAFTGAQVGIRLNFTPCLGHVICRLRNGLLDELDLFS